MRILSINVSEPEVILDRGKEVLTGIYKKPLPGPVMVRETQIDGDGQADLENHGGIDKAVYAFSAEHHGFYQESLEEASFEYGHFGENLTTEGMLESTVRIGDCFTVGTAVLEVSQPRTPCFKLAMKVGTTDVVKLMLDSARTGFYLRVVQEGIIEPGLAYRSFTRESAPTVEELHNLMFFDIVNVNELRRALAQPALGATWRDKLAARLKKLS